MLIVHCGASLGDSGSESESEPGSDWHYYLAMSASPPILRLARARATGVKSLTDRADDSESSVLDFFPSLWQAWSLMTRMARLASGHGPMAAGNLTLSLETRSPLKWCLEMAGPSWCQDIISRFITTNQPVNFPSTFPDENVRLTRIVTPDCLFNSEPSPLGATKTT